ncbi:MAG: glycosyltransferase family 4 protein [Candidatus Magasanikbacteria bacterium]|nr:glycosyltransferase family 4 protein [Candidatus Magasanikbacteria bacterium]
MRIAMIGQKGMPAKFGGVERHVHELSVRLVKVGNKVTVYSRKWYTNDKDGKIHGVTIKHLPSIRTKHLDAITHSLLATLDAIKNKSDVIHYHGVGPSLVSWIPRLFAPRIKVITTFHSIDRKHEKWGLGARLILKISEWTACKFAHETIVVSRTIEQYCRDVYDTQTTYIPNGASECRPTKKTDKIKKWGLKPQEYVLMVSRLIPHKGAHYLIDAYNEMCWENSIPANKKLVIVGDGHYTDSYVKRLKKMAAKNPDIIFTGFQTGKSLSQLYSHACLMVHPSDNEGTPISVLEAMSYGVPVLLSDIIEHREIVSNPKFLFARGDVESLKEKLKWLLCSDKEAGAKQIKINYATVKQNYDWDNIVLDVVEVYMKQILTPACEPVPAE